MTTTYLTELLSRIKIENDCWLWTLSVDQDGYGFYRGRRVHREVWKLLVGPIADQLDHHVCHNPTCVRPDHLRPATTKQNNENARQRPSASGRRGVYWSSRSRKWRVMVRHNGVMQHGGYFDDLDEADQAARALRLRLFTHNQHDQPKGRRS